MVLEATMICIDNSEWMRNGDYNPTRLLAQSEAVNLIAGAKTQSNPENTVGILTMAGKGVRVLTTPTTDLGNILACMQDLEMGGEVNLAAGIQIAQLALKHRQNKNQQQRIIVFAGSPINYDKKALETIGKKLKKNSVSLDIVNFGEDDDGKPEKLEALLAAVNNNDTSHLVHVPPGPDAFSDVILSSAVFTGDGGGSGFAVAAAAAAAGGGYDFGVDPNIDPELALALRVSMEEERARQEAAAKRVAEEASQEEKGGEPSASPNDITMAEHSNATAAETTENRPDSMDEDKALLDQALAMSMDIPDAVMSDALSDEQLALALQMSMQNESATDADVNKVLSDQDIMSSIIASLPGINPDDIANLPGSSESESKKKEDEAPKDDDK